MNDKIWKLTQSEFGKTYVSVPTDEPKMTGWKRTVSGLGNMVYRSGEYTITRTPYCTSGFTYHLKRQGIEMFGLYSRLRDAKLHAMRNAAGKETVHVA